ncbi:hypothetical protein Tsubulata_045227 [Turnera subulata]|uniref:Uncharacterized protein n=1 Tax=Turnera subulata TaxID=218843 RepID=A0A9Q0JPS2_9ROSI|nr:hypothetical protein Tsubulata_045227 [Turnera subulata]
MIMFGNSIEIERKIYSRHPNWKFYSTGTRFLPFPLYIPDRSLLIMKRPLVQIKEELKFFYNEWCRCSIATFNLKASA